MNVFHLSRDLMLIARASSEARSAGTRFQSAANVANLVDALQQQISTAAPGDKPFIRILVDLQTPGLEIAELKKKLDGLSAPIEVFAYAQHVLTDLINAANASEIGTVMTRGQFDRQLGDLVRKSASTQ